MDSFALEVTHEQLERVQEILRGTPVVGLKNNFAGDLSTLDEAIDHLASMSDMLGTVLRENEELKQQAWATDNDLAAAGRILKRMGFTR